MSDTLQILDEASSLIKGRLGEIPSTGVVLGSGLGVFTNSLEGEGIVKYSDIPGFPVPFLKEHAGELVKGFWKGRGVLVLKGRAHYYEGYTLKEVTFPIMVMRRLGIENLIVTNAAGGINPEFRPGDLMLIKDHMNLMGTNPLIGLHEGWMGERFPDMTNAYDPGLIELAKRVAREKGSPLREGVYAALSGPSYETPAEVSCLRNIGADAVGMSTVPEVIVGVQCGLEILGLTCITDMCLPDALEPADIERIIATAQGAAPRMMRLVERVVAEC